MITALFLLEGSASAATQKVMWGKTELKVGQIGKVTIKTPTIIWERMDSGALEIVRELKEEEEFRVYRYLDEQDGLYGVGSGMFIKKDISKVLYETPSKKKLVQLEGLTKHFFPYVKWGMTNQDVIDVLKPNNFDNGYSYLAIRDREVNTEFKHDKFENGRVFVFNFNPKDKQIYYSSQTTFSLKKYSEQDFNQVRDDFIRVISKKIGSPDEVFMNEGKYFDAIWRNGEEELWFSTGNGGDGNPYCSVSVINYKYDKSSGNKRK